MRFGSPIESNHRAIPTGYNPHTGEFKFTTARQPWPWRAALAWSALAGLAMFFVALFGAGL